MQRFIRRLCCGMFCSAILAGNTFAQQALTWQEIRARFEAANPSLRAGQIGIDESRANETTAYLRPNPNFRTYLYNCLSPTFSPIWIAPMLLDFSSTWAIEMVPYPPCDS